MGVIQKFSDAMHNPIPVATVDDILRRVATTPWWNAASSPPTLTP